MSDIINQNTEPLFIFDMPDDETLSETISVKGEKGERGDPTKLSDLENDEGFITKAADDLANYYDKATTDTKLGAKLDKTTFNAYEIPSDFFTSSDTVSGTGNSVTLSNTAETLFKRIDFYGDTAQAGTPTPDNPVNVDVVTGDQAIIITGNQPQTYTLGLGEMELCKIGNYQDYIYKSGDKWYKHKAIDGNTFAGYNDGNSYYTTTAGTNTARVNIKRATLSDPPYMSVAALGSLSSYADKLRYAESVSDDEHYYIVHNTQVTGGYQGQIRLYISRTRLENYSGTTDLENVRLWLQDNPIRLYSILATPVEEEITDSTLIAQLESIKSAKSCSGSTTITASGDLGAQLSVEAYKNGWDGTISGVSHELDTKADKTDVAKRAIYCDTVAAMKKADLASGSYAVTGGYYAYNDGGAAEYRIVDDATLTDDGATVHALDNGLKAVMIINDNTINVKQFGAKGDGATNDSSAIKKALEFRGDNYIKVKFNKNDVYIAYGTVYLYSNTDIELNGATIKATTELRLLTPEDAMESTGYGVVKNISVHGGTFQGATGQVIFGLLHASNIKFDSVKFLDCGRVTHTMDLGGCDHVLVQNCHFIGSYIAAANNFREVIQTDYATRAGLPYWEDDDAPAYDGLPSTDIEVTGCTFEKGDGTHYPNAIGTHAVYGATPIQRVKISKNIFKRCTYSAIRFLSIEGLVIDGNLFVNDSAEATDQSILAIRLVNDSLSATTYPTLYLKDIYISNNRFSRTAGYIGMTAVGLAARTDCPAKGVFVNNNIYEGAWNTSSDEHDFLHMLNVEDITIVDNILREPKIAFYATGTSAYFGTVNIRGNKITGARDVYNATTATLNPKNLTFDNNVLVFSNGAALNTTRFQESLTMSADFDATTTVAKVIPFDSYSNDSPFAANAAGKTLVPQAIHQFKVGGAVRFSVATSRDVYGCIKYYKNTSGGATKVKSEFRQYCVAGQQYTITFPERYIEPVNFAKAEIQAWVELNVQSGDKIYASGTVFNISGY